MRILSWNSAWMLPTCWATHFHKEQTFTEFRVFHHIFTFKSKSDIFKLSGGENLKIFRSKKIFFFGVVTVCKNPSQSVQGYSHEEGRTNALLYIYIYIYIYICIYIYIYIYIPYIYIYIYIKHMFNLH